MEKETSLSHVVISVNFIFFSLINCCGTSENHQLKLEFVLENGRYEK